jgi:Histidine phosphatase superfamily (branch 1)
VSAACARGLADSATPEKRGGGLLVGDLAVDPVSGQAPPMQGATPIAVRGASANAVAARCTVLADVYGRRVLLLVRHGETAANVDGLILGRADPPLTVNVAQSAGRGVLERRGSHGLARPGPPGGRNWYPPDNCCRGGRYPPTRSL